MQTHLSILAAAVMTLVLAGEARSESELSGQWRLDPEGSSAVDPWRSIELDLSIEGDQMQLEERLTTGRRNALQSWKIDLSEEVNEVPLDWWTGNRHIGAFAEAGSAMRLKGERLDGGKTIRLESTFVLSTSQSEFPVREYSEYRLSEDGETLTRMTLRSTRPLPILHVFKRY